MTNLDILNDKDFFDYLLQSLTDHYSKLSGYDNVTIRPEFTEEFFANYWLQLMKIAQLENVPTVIIDDHEHQGKVNNGFDSIHRSLFEVCESRINLRVTTRFVLNGKKLDDEEEIVVRNLFMLILLFVSEWVADKQDECPHVTFKQPLSGLIPECFDHLFKDIYFGKDENFKDFVFDDDKENSFLSPSVYSSILEKSDISFLNITPTVEKSMQTENHSIDQISQTNMDTITQDEENVVADYKTLQDILNDKIVEIERINKSNADLMEEKENLQLNFLKTNKNLENLVYQKELENKDIFDEKESLNIVIGKLQIKLDTCKKELSTSYMENDRQKQNDDAIKIYSTNKEKELEEEKEALQKVFEAKILELNGMNKLNEELAEEKRLLEHHLLNTKHELVDANKLIDQKESDNKNIIIENISLNDVIGKLQIQCDKFKEELESSVMENDRLKEENDGLMKAVHNYTSNEEKLAEEKQVIQQVLDDKLVEIDDMSKVNEDLVGEKNLLEQELLKAKRELADSNYLVIQKEAEIKNIFDDKQSLDGIINKLQMDYDICKDEFSNALIENDRLKEENEELIKVVNRKTRNEEKLEEEKEVLQQVLDSKTLEMDKLKQLLSNVQTELRFVVSKIRGLYVIKSELEAELDSFKIYFDHVTSSLSNTWANVKTLFDDFAAERLHNVSLSNQLEALQQEITVRERSRTPSLHDEGIMAYDSRRESFNGPALFDGENISQLMSFDERDEMRLDSGIGSNEPTPGTTPRDNIEQQSLVDQCTSSVFSQYLIFTFSLILFYIIYICLYGAIVPSWVYIKLRHERMPPQ